MDGCFHGGAFWDSIPLDRLAVRQGVVNADVLDAWFPPAPAVVQALRNEWLLRTSPPTHAEGLEREIAARFSVSPASVLAGPGSSALMFLAFARWLTPESRVLLVEPTYGEYAYLCEKVIGCSVDRIQEVPGHLGQWGSMAESYDLAVLVNPNNPTGTLIPTAELAKALPRRCRVWIDEAYLAYTGQPSVAPIAAELSNIAVVRSFSKSHALSGVRTAALFANPALIGELRSSCPPWWVSLPAQVATVVALKEEDYYCGRYAETCRLRQAMAQEVGLPVLGAAANWLLVGLPLDGPKAADVVRRCAERGVYVRDAGKTAPSLGERAIRIAVKEEWGRVLDELRNAVTTASSGP